MEFLYFGPCKSNRSWEDHTIEYYIIFVIYFFGQIVESLEKNAKFFEKFEISENACRRERVNPIQLIQKKAKLDAVYKLLYL